jgi:hypothetical protein
MMPLLMRTRTESAVYFEQKIDVGPAQAFIEQFNADHPETRITFFHLVLWAVVQTLAERPRLNRFTMGGRIYQRRGIWISYSAKKAFSDDAPVFVVKREIDPALGFAELVRLVHGGVGEGRSDKPTYVDKELGLLLKLPLVLLSLMVRLLRRLDAWNLLPQSFIRNDPMYASAFIANLGSLKIDAAFHHNWEYGNIPIFVTLGQVHDGVVARPDGSVGVRPEALLRWTFDERIEDGLYCARALDLLRRRLEDPAGAIAAAA